MYKQSKARTVEDMLAALEPMEITVTDPTKEEDSYISYQVNTKVTRRYNMFKLEKSIWNREMSLVLTLLGIDYLLFG